MTGDDEGDDSETGDEDAAEEEVSAGGRAGVWGLGDVALDLAGCVCGVSAFGEGDGRRIVFVSFREGWGDGSDNVGEGTGALSYGPIVGDDLPEETRLGRFVCEGISSGRESDDAVEGVRACASAGRRGDDGSDERVWAGRKGTCRNVDALRAACSDVCAGVAGGVLEELASGCLEDPAIGVEGRTTGNPDTGDAVMGDTEIAPLLFNAGAVVDIMDVFGIEEDGEDAMGVLDGNDGDAGDTGILPDEVFVGTYGAYS